MNKKKYRRLNKGKANILSANDFNEYLETKKEEENERLQVRSTKYMYLNYKGEKWKEVHYNPKNDVIIYRVEGNKEDSNWDYRIWFVYKGNKYTYISYGSYWEDYEGEELEKIGKGFVELIKDWEPWKRPNGRPIIYSKHLIECVAKLESSGERTLDLVCEDEED